MGKKKRKLVIKATGAGDPTYFLKINIPLISGESSGDTLDISIQATIGVNQYIAMDFSGPNAPAVPLGVDVHFGSSFLASAVPASDEVSCDIRFLSEEYDFEFEAPSSMHGTESGNTVHFPSIQLTPAGNKSLNEQNLAVLQSLENHDQGNFVFLNEDGNSLVTNSIFSTNDASFVWEIEEVSQSNGLYTIQNQNTGMYLGITDHNHLGYSSSGQSAQAYWQCSKINNDLSQYEISIEQNGDRYYLYSDSTDMSVSLSTQSTSWYLYLLGD